MVRLILCFFYAYSSDTARSVKRSFSSLLLTLKALSTKYPGIDCSINCNYLRRFNLPLLRHCYLRLYGLHHLSNRNIIHVPLDGRHQTRITLIAVVVFLLYQRHLWLFRRNIWTRWTDWESTGCIKKNATQLQCSKNFFPSIWLMKACIHIQVQLIPVLHVQKEFRDLHAILEINRFLLKVPFWPK